MLYLCILRVISCIKVKENNHNLHIFLPENHSSYLILYELNQIHCEIKRNYKQPVGIHKYTTNHSNSSVTQIKVIIKTNQEQASQ